MSIKEQRRRFLQRWRSRQGPLTLWDLDKRDRFLLKPSLWFFRHGCTANRITFAGFLWTLVWIWSYAILGFRHPLVHLFCFIIPIGLTDLFDGSVARNNDDVTPGGTLGDHFRDLLYTLFLGYMATDYGFDYYLFATVVLLESLILLFKVVAFVWYGRGYSWDRFLEFSLDNFQHTYEDRWQSNFLYFGFPAYIVGAYYGIYALELLGQALVVFSFGISFFVLRKEWNWAPEKEIK